MTVFGELEHILVTFLEMGEQCHVDCMSADAKFYGMHVHSAKLKSQSVSALISSNRWNRHMQRPIVKAIKGP